MSINLRPKNIYGSMQYQDHRFKITASKVNDKWYASIDGVMFDAGFCNVSCMSDFYDKFQEYEESLNMLGYFKSGNIFVNDSTDGFLSEISIKDDGIFNVRSHVCEDGQTKCYEYSSSSFSLIEEYILGMLHRLNIDIFASVTIASSDEVKHVIEAKMTSRDLSKNLVRVKSSNLWSYGINIKDRKDKTGEVIVQFKDAKGGPGDLYQYLDVPVNLWRRWLAAPSKGHFLWQYIRNNFKYRKLTGDKRGKLPNAIN